MIETICARCGDRPARNGQRWCNKCRRGYKKGDAANGANRPRTVTHRYLPFLGGRPAIDEPWYDAYLSHLSYHGAPELAAYAAAVHPDHADATYQANADFSREVDTAAHYFVALMEWESVDLARRKNNPLPYFARLKADRPDRYHDKVIDARVYNLTVAHGPAPPDAEISWLEIKAAILSQPALPAVVEPPLDAEILVPDPGSPHAPGKSADSD